MRNSLVLLAALAGCGFRAPGGVAVDPDAANPDGQVTADAPITVDAAADASPDAPTDAPPCADVDSDGVCDTQDIWLCGPQPNMPGNTVTLDDTQNGDHQTTTLSGTSLGTTGKLRTVAPGATFSVSTNSSITDCICTGCIDQIQLGLVPGTTKKCVYDGNPPCPGTATAQTNVTLTAPMTPGVYDIRFRIGQDYGCEGMNGMNFGWWTNVPPGAGQTVAKICVR